MSEILLNYGVGSYISQDILIVSFQSDFYHEVISELESHVLYKLHHNPQLTGLIVDVNNIKIMDVFNMSVLEKIFNMGEIFGVVSYLTGLQPQVVLALIDLDYEPGKFNTAINIEQAICHIHKKIESKQKAIDGNRYENEEVGETKDKIVTDNVNQSIERPVDVMW